MRWYLSDIFCHGVNARDSDIQKVIRHNDIRKGYNSANKIFVLEAEMKKEKTSEVRIEEIKTETKIMLELIQESETQLLFRKVYSENKTKGEKYLQLMLDGLTNNDYSFIG